MNPVAGPYDNFTIPEPTGVVGVVSPAAENVKRVVHFDGASIGWEDVSGVEGRAAPDRDGGQASVIHRRINGEDACDRVIERGLHGCRNSDPL